MMYQKLTSEECEKIKIIEKVTQTNYEMLGEFIPSDSLMIMIEDLYIELEKEREKNADLKQDIEDNYRPISIAEQVGYRSSDFI